MTSKRVAHDAGKVLSDRKSTKKEKEIAGSALEQRRSSQSGHRPSDGQALAER